MAKKGEHKGRDERPKKQMGSGKGDEPKPAWFKLILPISFIIFILILYLMTQQGDDQYAAKPNPLAPNDVSITIVNQQENGTAFEIHVDNARNYTVSFADTFYYYISVYNSTSGERINRTTYDGYCYYNDDHAILPIPPEKTFIMNGSVDTEGLANGTYYVGVDFHLRDFYDNIVVYSSQRVEFTVGDE